MHPPLFRPHPQCEDVVRVLVRCHEEHPIGKFVGRCNAEKVALDKCFKSEKAAKRRENFEKAKARRERWEKYREEHLDTGKNTDSS